MICVKCGSDTIKCYPDQGIITKHPDYEFITCDRFECLECGNVWDE